MLSLDPFAAAARLLEPPPTHGHVYAPRGRLVSLFDATDSEVLVAGPAGTGKSRAALELIHQRCMTFPGAQMLLVRKTGVSLAASGLKTWEKFVVRQAMDAGEVTFFGGSAREPAAYRYRNGSRVVVGGMDKALKIMSTEYDCAFVQEATELTLDDWESITTRLRAGTTPVQQLIADCNPDVPTHWLKQRADAGVTRMIESRHEDNPVLFDDDGTLTERGRAYMATLDNLTGVRHQRLRLGLWVAAEGQIYESFDPATHVVDSLPAGSEKWRRIWSVDFGFTNPFVLQRWAIDGDGRAWLFAERYRTQGLVEDHARAVLAEVAPGGVWSEPRPEAIICDHDAEDRATLERHLGMPTRAAKKAVSQGIEAVAMRLRPAGDGKPRLFLVRDAVTDRDPLLANALKPTSTLDEFPGYVWEAPTGGRPPKEQPRKVDDHGMDATRYLVAHLDLGGGPPRMRYL